MFIHYTLPFHRWHALPSKKGNRQCNARSRRSMALIAAGYMAACYGLIPHKNGAATNWRAPRGWNAEAFARSAAPPRRMNHAAMVDKLNRRLLCELRAWPRRNRRRGQSDRARGPPAWPGRGTDCDGGHTRETMATRRGRCQRKAGASMRRFRLLRRRRGLSELLIEGVKTGKGKILYQHGVCAHQYPTPSIVPAQFGGGASNKACHPLDLPVRETN